MESENRNFDILGKSKGLHYNDPLVIGAGALVLGFAIGSGRWNWLGQEVAKLADSLVSLALTHVNQTLHDQHPEFFTHKSRVTH